MEIKEGYLSFRGYKTYYRIANPNGKKTPLLMLHGGPGSCHDSFEIMDDFAFLDDRPVVTYDQLGCGKSSLDDPHINLWKKETWVEELINARSLLNLNKVHLLGHSWGGMLAIIYLTDYKPYGIQSLTLSSTLSSASLWKEETHRLVNLLPQEEKLAIYESEVKNDFSSLEFKLAYQHYYETFIFGPVLDEYPECIKRKVKSGTESYLTAWGECEFSPSGTLKNYEYTDKLKEITCPVLLCSGANDESTPLQNKVMYDNIQSHKEWYLFSKSRHKSYIEEHELYNSVLKEFLNKND